MFIKVRVGEQEAIYLNANFITEIRLDEDDISGAEVFMQGEDYPHYTWESPEQLLAMIEARND